MFVIDITIDNKLVSYMYLQNIRRQTSKLKLREPISNVSLFKTLLSLLI